MPVASLEQLKEKETSLTKALGELAETTDAAKRRAMGKKLRRAQRKRRKAVIEVERQAAKSKTAPEETKAEAGAATEQAAETQQTKEE